MRRALRVLRRKRRVRSLVRSGSRLASAESVRVLLHGEVHEPQPGETLQEWMTIEREASRRRRLSVPEAVSRALDEAHDEVTVVCVTNRPQLLDRAIENVRRQSLRPRLLLVTNADTFDDTAVEAALADLPEARRLHMAPDVTLGECLNAALDECSTRFVAKMDDDDHYDEDYLADQITALLWAGAGVVGKHTCLAHLAASDTTIVRFPGRENRFVGFVGGGTIVADRQQVGAVRFPHRDTGEDSGFLASSEAAGALVLSTGCLGYVQYRGADNTWKVSDDRFAEGSMLLGNGSPDGCFDTPRP